MEKHEVDEAVERYNKEFRRPVAAGETGKAKDGQMTKRVDCQRQLTHLGQTPVPCSNVGEAALGAAGRCRAVGDRRSASGVGVGVMAGPPAPESPAQQYATSAPKKTQLGPKVDLKLLMEAKLLEAGDAIACKNKEGRIAADGFIYYNGKQMKVCAGAVAERAGCEPMRDEDDGMRSR